MTVAEGQESLEPYSVSYQLLLCISVLLSVVTITIVLQRKHLLPYAIIEQAVVWIFTLYITSEQRKRKLHALFKSIRERAVLAYCLFLLLLTGSLLIIGLFHKAAFYFVLSGMFWFVCAILSFALTRGDGIRLIRNLSNSKLAGLLALITVFLSMMTTAEIVLRHSIFCSQWCPIVTMKWFHKYWHPINSLKYRDYPVGMAEAPDVKRVVVVGDSFPTGIGIESIDDTFPQVLRQKLGPKYLVNTVAHPGYDTLKEVDRLNHFPEKADILILSYVFNDAEYFIKKPVIAYPPKPTQALIERYYVANLAYWAIWSNVIKQGRAIYEQKLRNAWRNEKSWQKHVYDLTRFITYCQENQCRLIVLVWPRLDDLNDREIQDKVTKMFQSKGVKVVDILPLLKPLARSERVINFTDGHPSLLVHHIAGNLLYQEIAHSINP